MVAAYEWLVAQGLWNDVVAVLVSLIVARVFWPFLRDAWVAHVWRQHRMIEQQTRIADLLDTDKPGGLTDVIEALERRRERGEP